MSGERCKENGWVLPPFLGRAAGLKEGPGKELTRRHQKKKTRRREGGPREIRCGQL